MHGYQRGHQLWEVGLVPGFRRERWLGAGLKPPASEDDIRSHSGPADPRAPLKCSEQRHRGAAGLTWAFRGGGPSPTLYVALPQGRGSPSM